MTADAISARLVGRRHSVHYTWKSTTPQTTKGKVQIAQKLFKTCFDVIFRSAYSQSLLKKKICLQRQDTRCSYVVCVFMCVRNIISSVGKAINILLIILSTLRLLNYCCSSQVFCILTVFFLMSTWNSRWLLQDNVYIYWYLNIVCK